MRTTHPWNTNWQYIDTYKPEFIEGGKTTGTEEVDLPHTNSKINHNYFDESIYQKVCGYRKTFKAEDDWQGKSVRLHLLGAAHHATVFLNGEQIADHKGGYTAFYADLTEALVYGKENTLAIRLDSRSQLNMPPFGKVIDYMTFGGLYREVYLEVTEPCRIDDVFIQTPGSPGHTKQVGIQTMLRLPADSADGLTLKHAVIDRGKALAGYSLPAAEGMVYARFDVPNVRLWALDSPHMYTLRTRLYKGETLLDEVQNSFGFRSARFEKDGFYLNGEHIKIFGLNRHQGYPSVGYAMPERPQRLDAKILKHELGVNAVRTSHYPQSQAFIDECDKLGLLVFMEIPGWQHIGGEEWKDIAVKNTREMIMQYRNHPSIVLWGVRVNESQDDDELYARTNAVARELDPSRQTSGARFTQKGSLLEDVYAYNDFSHIGPNAGVLPKSDVTSDMEKPYIISEYAGHMFPTKSFDWEEKRLEHALRHARVIDGYFGYDDICGGFGWCMADYHTSQDFGSGDRICYHGVLDMHRIPKLAAAVYKSQFSRRSVLEISSSMDIGEHPVGHLGRVYAFTNADSVRVYKNGELIREFFPDRQAFPYMPHPPILIDDFVGDMLEEKEGLDKKTADAMKEIMGAVAAQGLSNLSLSQRAKMLYYMRTKNLTFDDCYRIFGEYMGNWGGEATAYTFEAVKDGQVVHTVRKEPAKRVVLEAWADTKTLTHADTYDAATVRIRALDQNGNTLPYYQEALRLQVKGPIQLMGDEYISMKGGAGGCYVRTTGTAGKASLRISAPGVEVVEIAFTVEADKEG